jgi:hypothetical protein
MNKMPLDWHKENLVNWNATLMSMRKQLEDLKSKLEVSEKQYAFYNYQILQADLKEKTSFDRDKFCHKRVIVHFPKGEQHD